MRREYPSKPFVGVGALIKRNDEILIVKRGNEPGKGLWSVPGGLVETGETLIEAVKREVKEETGLKIKVLKLIDVLENIVRDENGKVRFHYVLIDFLAEPIGGKLTPKSDILDAKWVRISDLDKFKVTNTLRKLLKKLTFS